jgi:hypothetical protein
LCMALCYEQQHEKATEDREPESCFHGE